MGEKKWRTEGALRRSPRGCERSGGRASWSGAVDGQTVEHGAREIAKKAAVTGGAGEALMRMASSAEVSRTAEGRFHARVPVNGRHDILLLKSRAFRDWLVDAYVNAHQKLPPRRAVHGVIEALEARARFANEGSTTYVR